MPFVEKRITCGDYMRVERHHVLHIGKRAPRSMNFMETGLDQQAVNDREARKKLEIMIRGNFDGKRGDIFATFDHAQDVEEAEAMRARHNLFRCLRYFFKNNNLGSCDYIVVSEKQSKWHHHVIMRGLPNALEALAKMWGDHGGVKLSTLANGFIDNLVNYLLATEKDAKMDERPKYARRWSCSKGLKRPQVEYNEIKPLRPSSQPRAPRGYMLLPSWHIGCDKRGNIYQVFNCTKIKRSKPPRSATPRGKSVTKGRKTDVLQNMSNVRLNA